jgi:hypothetical protein
MFERRHEPLLSRSVFFWRLAKCSAISLGFILVSLALGVLGYRQLANMSWVDSYVNAAMILGGMGPVGELSTDAAKLFAGTYALYCGLVVIISVGFLIAPILHRFLHYFHVDSESDEGGEENP